MIDLTRLHNNKEVRSVRSRQSIERDIKIFRAQMDLISGRYNYSIYFLHVHYFDILILYFTIFFRLPLQQFLRMFIGNFDDDQYKENSIIQSK